MVSHDQIAMPHITKLVPILDDVYLRLLLSRFLHCALSIAIHCLLERDRPNFIDFNGLPVCLAENTLAFCLDFKFSCTRSIPLKPNEMYHFDYVKDEDHTDII